MVSMSAHVAARPDGGGTQLLLYSDSTSRKASTAILKVLSTGVYRSLNGLASQAVLLESQ